MDLICLLCWQSKMTHFHISFKCSGRNHTRFGNSGPLYSHLKSLLCFIYCSIYQQFLGLYTCGKTEQKAKISKFAASMQSLLEMTYSY